MPEAINSECLNYNCDELPEYENTISLCAANTRNGGASTFYLIECGESVTDPGDEDELDALVAAGGAVKIENVKIGFAAPTAVTIDPITSCGSIKTINYTREANIEDYKVTLLNTAFWSVAKKRTYGAAVMIECETSGLARLVTVINSEIDVESYRDFPNNQDAAQKYVITLRWKSLDDPLQEVYTAA